MSSFASLQGRDAVRPGEPQQARSGSDASLRHLPVLDGLRGVAIALVLAHNFDIIGAPRGMWAHALDVALNVGWIGVQLFFVLSGFLITRILLHTQDSANYFAGFYARRVLRIFPLYYGTLLVAFVILPLLVNPPAGFAQEQAHQAWLWLYLSNISNMFGFESQVFPHFWSLAIEEQFYLLWPLLVHRRSPFQVLRLCVAIAVFSVLVRVALLWHGTDVHAVYTMTFCRMDALAMGAAVAAFLKMPGAALHVRVYRRRLAWGTLALLVAGFVLTHGYPRTTYLEQTLGYSWLAFAFALIVLALVSQEPVGGRAPRWEQLLSVTSLRTLGKYSYSMYVFHKPLHDWVGLPALKKLGMFPEPSGTVAIIYFLVLTAVTLLFGAVSYHLIEKHFIGLKRFFVVEARRPATAAADMRQ
jgi:peptidoglycan/LPS O-acetylase OafA/YrhL